LLFFGCSSHYSPLKTVDKVNLKFFLGKWYEIARYDHFFEEGCSDVNATYSLRENGEIDVLNQCIKENKLSQVKGVAYAIDATNSKLRVSFFRPFYGNYWILVLGKNYDYAVIGEPSREYLWILSRTPNMAQSLKEAILEKLIEFDYDPEKLFWAPVKGK
jgi:apolipoprotein D and lipocalin family protein